MALAWEAGIPVVGRGSGTGLSGGAISHPDGIQIAFTRMNRILEVNRENRHAVVEPGVINLDLDTYVRKFGMRYAPDPSSQRACSLGGNIAENAGGPHCLAYGTTTKPRAGDGGSAGGWDRSQPGQPGPGRGRGMTCEECLRALRGPSASRPASWCGCSLFQRR